MDVRNVCSSYRVAKRSTTFETDRTVMNEVYRHTGPRTDLKLCFKNSNRVVCILSPFSFDPN